MHANRFRIISGITVLMLFLVTACSSITGTTSTNGSTSATATSTPQPTATSVAIPVATISYCEGLLTIAEANKILNPVNPIVGVQIANSTNNSSCKYTDASNNVLLLLNFAPFSSGTQINTAATQYIAQVFNNPNTAIVTSHAVSGVGNQAWYISSKITGGNISGLAKVLCIAAGGLQITLTNISMNGTGLLSSVSDVVVQGEFVQAAALIISRM